MTVKNILVAPVGDNIDALFVGIREFPTEKVILMTPEDKLGEAERARMELEKFGIPVKIEEIKGNLWEAIFESVSKIKRLEKDREIIINVATGDRNSQCAATSAAFVNGIKAFSIEENQAMLLPVLKFSYYKMLTDKKIGILKLLVEPDCCASLEELSKRTKMSLPLVSYHINGTLKSEGLKQLGLVETVESKGRTSIRLTTLGRMLIKGYIS